MSRDADVAEFLSVMRAEIADPMRFQELPAINHLVSVERSGPAECIVAFHDGSGRVIASEAANLDSASLADADWIAGAHGDGWIETAAELELEASGSLAFRLYLPPSPLFDSKEFVAEVDGEEVARCNVPRDGVFTTPPFPLGQAQPVRVRLSAAYADPGASGDQRELGFVVVQVLVDGAPITPYRQ